MKSIEHYSCNSASGGDVPSFKRRFVFLVLFFAVHLGLVPFSHAASGITYTGRIVDANNAAVVSTNVKFTTTLYDPASKCWLYTEQRQLDLSQSAGTFSFDIGANDSTLIPATASFNNEAGPTGVKSMLDVFSNTKTFSGLGTANGCSGTFTPNPSDLTAGRYLSIYFSVDGGPAQALPLLKINPVPSALTVAGYGTGELLKIDSSVNPSLNGNPNNGLDQTQYDEFWRLVKNPLSAYLPGSGDVTLVSGNNKLTTLLGQSLPAGPATNGQALVSNGTAWVLQSVSSGSVSSVSANAPLSVGGTASAPVISLPAATTSVDGYLKSADWNTFNGKQSASLVSGKVWIGNGSGLAEAQSLSGDAALAANGALTLATTTTAATKGTAQNVPQITYDAKGRITSVTEVAIDDNTKLAKSGGTMTGPIAMGAQDITNTGNITMAANKYLGLSANSTDGTVAGQMWYDSGIIKYFDGTTVKSLGVAGAGITNFNGSSVGSQSLAVPGTSGTAPNWSTNTGTGVHTLNIPMASTATVTAGLLSKTDYDRIGKSESLNGKAFDTTAASTMGQILYFDSAADKWKVSTAAAPTDGQVMKWNDTAKAWEPGNDSAGWTAVDASYAAKGIVQFQTDAATSGINVASGVATVVRTTTGQNSTILSLDGSGIANMYAAGIKGATSGTVTLQAPTTTANYSLTLPNVAPTAGESLQADALGNLSWVSTLTSINNSASLTSNNIWVGNASNKAVETAPSSFLIMKGGQSGATSLGTTDATDLTFLTNNAARMTLTSGGSLGIGTTNPGSALEVSKNLPGDGAASLITLTGAGAVATARGLQIVANYTGTSSSLYGIDVYANKSDAGVNAVYGISARAVHNRTSGGTAAAHYGGKFVLTGPSSASTATNLTYYGVYGEANSTAPGETSTVYGVYAKAVGPSTVIGLRSDASGGSTNYAGIFTGGNVGIDTQTPATSLDVSGVTRSTGVDLNSTYGGSQVSVRAPAAFTSYTLTLPTSAGSANQVLATDGSGTLSWASVMTGVNNIASLTSNKIWVGNASNLAVETDPSSLFLMRDGSVAMTGSLKMGGNKIYGNSTSGGDLTIESTSDATKGFVLLQPNGGNVGVGSTNPASARLQVYSTSTLPMLVQQSMNSSLNKTIATFKRGRNDATAPVAEFGGTLDFQLEGFTDSSSVGAASLVWAWDKDQTNDTTDRDAYVAIQTMQDNTLSERLRITAGGNVGIGTSNPTYALTVNGVIAPSGDGVSDLGAAGNKFNNVYAANAVIQTSDARQKREIQNSDLGLDFIRSLRPVSYYWKQGDSYLHYGVIAQETKQALIEAKKRAGQPEDMDNVIVSHDQKTDAYGVRYTELIAPVIKAIQDLYDKVVGHESALSEQSRELASEKQRVRQLELENARLKAEAERIKTWICEKDPGAALCL